MEDAESAGIAIKAMREAQGLSLRRLAVLAGTSASYISQVERGDKHPTRRWLVSVHDALARNMRIFDQGGAA